MAYLDRTIDFHKKLDEASKKYGPSASSRSSVHSGASGGKASSQFQRLAIQLNSDLKKALEKLAKLTQLCQSSSLFRDPTADIEELTYIIKQDLAVLNARMEDLRSSADQRRKVDNEQSIAHSEHVVGTLKGSLMHATKEFQNVLQLRTQRIKEKETRRSRYVHTPKKDTEIRKRSVLVDAATSSSFSSGAEGDVAITMPESSGEGQVMELEQSSYHAVREEAVISIERTIAELGQMFQHFAGLVAEQGDLVRRIDSDIEDTVANVEAGQSELLKYYKSISSNRWLIFKVFIVLVLFVVFFTTVVL